MPRRKADDTAAELLGRWTDSDTAMQIVGTSLGVFGIGRLDPAVVLARETPLRNALFDVLLNLVEGGALDVRPTDDGHYAFRWRSDYAVGAMNSDAATTVDIEPPSPYLAELAQVRDERDAALQRASSAEARAGVPAAASGVDVVDADADADVVARALERAFQVPATTTTTIDLVAFEADERDDADVDAPDPDPGDVVYLAPPAPTAPMPTGKWSAYTLEHPRPHTTTAERLANQS
jgi:hypothetical protein